MSSRTRKKIPQFPSPSRGFIKTETVFAFFLISPAALSPKFCSETKNRAVRPDFFLFFWFLLRQHTDEPEISLQQGLSLIAEGPCFAEPVQVFPGDLRLHIGSKALKIGKGQIPVVRAAVLAAVTAPHKAVFPDQLLLSLRQLSLSLGHLGKAAAVVDAIPARRGPSAGMASTTAAAFPR